MKDIYYIDLDYTLWNTNSKWWIIDKNNATKPIIKIMPHEGILIMSGFYKQHDNYISYNGREGWLSDEMLLKIKKHKNVDLENIGISTREYSNEELILNQYENVIIYIDRFQHLKNKDVIILTARGNKKYHKKLLDLLKNKLKENDINVIDEYFVNDYTNFNNIGTQQEKKLYCILQSITGHVLENNKFTAILHNKHDEIHFYDDEELNINEGLKINDHLKILLANTEPWIKQRIEESLNFREVKLFTHQLTSNEMNAFITKEIKIQIK